MSGFPVGDGGGVPQNPLRPTTPPTDWESQWRQTGSWADGVALVAQTLYAFAIPMSTGANIKTINFLSDANPGLLLPVQQIAAAFDSQGNLLAQSIDYTSRAWASRTLGVFPMITPAAVPQDDFFYACILLDATTVVGLEAIGSSRTEPFGGGNGVIAPILYGPAAPAQTSIPSTIPLPLPNSAYSSLVPYIMVES